LMAAWRAPGKAKIILVELSWVRSMVKQKEAL